MLKFKIKVDESADSPLNNDRLSKIVTWHSRYNLGDEQPTERPVEWLENILSNNGIDVPGDALMDDMLELFEEHVGIISIVYMYEHSGISLSLSPFSCNWDSGSVGFAYIEYSYAKSNGTHDIGDMKRVLKDELTEYSYYIEGEVYYYHIWSEEVCSCCGGSITKTICSGYGYIGDHKTSGIYEDMYDDLTCNGYDGSYEDMIEELG